MNKKQLIVSFACLSLIACGNKEKETGSESDSQKDSVATEEVATSKFIDPASFDFSKPVNAEEIYNSIMFFYDQEFQFLVYPYNNKIIAYSQAYSGPDNTDLSLHFRLKDGMEKELEKNTPIVVKGKIVATNYNCINIEGAVVVSEGKADAVAAFDINKHNASNIYNPRHMYDFLTKWEAKNVSIKGFYQGYTESGGATILERRVDVGPDTKSLIGCAFKDNPGVGDKLSSGVDVVTIKGIISHDLTYGRPYMTDCELVK